MFTLNAEKRTAGNADNVRKAGKIPAVFYGPKEESTVIALDAKEFAKVWREAGETSIVTITGLGAEKEALIHEVSYHPVSGTIEHVDFYVVEKGKKVQAGIPVSFVGESPAVKNLGGTLMKIMHEIEVEALPKDLPREIEVDISKLATFDSRITVGDIMFGAGVTVLADADETIAAIAEPKEEEQEPVAAIDMESIEVEKKGKQEEEEAPQASETE